VGAPQDMALPADIKENEEIAVRSETDPSASLEMNANLMHLSVNGSMNGYEDEKDTPGLPDSNEAAIKLFYDHLANVSLSLEPSEIGDIQVGGMNMAVRREDGTVNDYRKFVTIRVSRKIGDLPVFGASRAIAQLGANGGLHSLVFNWTPVANANDATPPEVRQDDEINRGINEALTAKGADAKEITVNVSRLVLYDDGTGTIEPVYLVVGDAKYVNEGQPGGQKELTVPLDMFVPVLKNSTVRLPDRDDFMPKEGP
jgi:hypothetical protein